VQSNLYYSENFSIKELRGKREQSYGIAQIHLPAHPHITLEQALDPLWSIEWMAEQFAEGRENMWTCHKLLANK